MERLQYFSQELQGVQQARQQQSEAEAHANARATMEELTGPEGIKGFGREKLAALADYAITELGFDRAYVDRMGGNRGDAKLLKASTG